MQEVVVLGHGEGGVTVTMGVWVAVVVLRRSGDVKCGWWGTL